MPFIAIRCERCQHTGFTNVATLPRIMTCVRCGHRQLFGRPKVVARQRLTTSQDDLRREIEHATSAVSV
jgi:hypothetical protein